MSKEEIIDEYNNKNYLFNEFNQSMNALLSALLSSNKIHPHSITSRVKDLDSLSRKVDKKKKYESYLRRRLS